MDNEVLGSQLVKYRKLYHYTQEDIARDATSDYLQKSAQESDKKRSCTQMDLDYLNIYFDLPEQLRSDARLHLEFLQFKAKGIL